MGAVTSKIRFYTNVMKLGSRNPLLLARQVGSVANLTNNRFGFGVGIGWAPEEFEWCGVPYAKRGKRVDEMIEIIKLIIVPIGAAMLDECLEHASPRGRKFILGLAGVAGVLLIAELLGSFFTLSEVIVVSCMTCWLSSACFAMSP